MTHFMHRGISYPISVSMLAGKGGEKKIFTAIFQETAPAGLEPGKKYCMKVITITREMLHRKSVAQLREYYDLIHFEGDHLRRVLCMDDAAMLVVKDLAEKGIPTYREIPSDRDPAIMEPLRCAIIEPYCTSPAAAFVHAGDLTVYERLELLRQYALGCRELYRCHVNGHSVIAHRDLKPENAVLEQQGDRFRIRLIDFSSIRLDSRRAGDHTPDFVVDPVAVTKLFPMSPQNTAPEHILSDRKEFAFSEKTDVYALGMMLASLFSSVMRKSGDQAPQGKNPCHVWFSCVERTSGNLDLQEALRQHFLMAKQLDAGETSTQHSWLEQSLDQMDLRICWSREEPAVLASIRDLFFRSTRILPESRCSLDTFLKILENLMEDQKAAGKVLRSHHPSLYGQGPAKPNGPVSLFLFDRTIPQARLPLCLQKAGEIMAREQKESRVPPRALVADFSQDSGSDHSHRVQIFSVFDDPRGFREIQALNPDGAPGKGLAQALYLLYSQLYELRQQDKNFSLSGNLHLFLGEAPPAPHEISHVQLPNGSLCDLNMLLGPDGLGFFLRGAESYLNVTVYCPRDRADADEYPAWYYFVPCGMDADPTPDPVPVPIPGPSPQAQPETSSPFLTGESGFYFLDEGSNPVYICLKKEV